MPLQIWNAAAAMDLNQLRAFVRVAELRSISASARAMGAPKSTVSRELARLEATLGSTLVERSTRRLRLTDAGQLLLPHAVRIMNEVDEAEAALGRFVGTPRGTLRVSAPYAFALGAVTPMLPGFLARYPDVDVLLERDASWTEISMGDADLIIRISPLPDTSMVGRRIATVELWTCASPGYLAARGAPADLAALAGHDIVGLVGPRSAGRSATRLAGWRTWLSTPAPCCRTRRWSRAPLPAARALGSCRTTWPPKRSGGAS